VHKSTSRLLGRIVDTCEPETERTALERSDKKRELRMKTVRLTFRFPGTW
jgi:hypothetical protein